MKSPAKAKGKTKNVPFDPIFFAATVPARKPTDKDAKDVKEHENDPIEPKEHDVMSRPPRNPKWRDTVISANVAGLVRFKGAQDWLDKARGEMPPSAPRAGAEEFRRFLVERNGGRNVSPDAAARLYNDFRRSRDGQQ